MEKNKGLIREEHVKVLKTNHVYLISNLTARDLTHYLFQYDVFDDDDMQHIRKEEDRGRKYGIEAFLDVLMRSGDSTYPIFVRCLNESGYKQVARQLEQSRMIIEERTKQEEAEKLMACEKVSKVIPPEENSNKKRGQMAKKHSKILQRQRLLLLDELRAKDLIDKMFQDNLFDANDVDEISVAENTKGRQQGVVKLLETLHFSGGDAYPKFINCLRYCGYVHVADTLEQTDN